MNFAENNVIDKLFSAEGEVISTVTPVKTKGMNVETWMTNLEHEMVVSVRNVMEI